MLDGRTNLYSFNLFKLLNPKIALERLTHGKRVTFNILEIILCLLLKSNFSIP